MQIGFNFTSGGSLPLVQQLLNGRRIDFCEILIDNFLHLSPALLARAFDCPVSFHIMQSRWLERDAATLDTLGRRLRHFIEVLDPLYVSDHLAHFSHRGRALYHLAEIDYSADDARVFERVEQWQARLGRQLLLENFPSIMDGAHDAARFFERLCNHTGTGMLFDASNAVCAFRNTGAPLQAWAPLLAATSHYHVAGYGASIMQPPITLDTHAGDMAADTLAFLREHASSMDKPGATLVYERDAALDHDAIAAELGRLRAVFDKQRSGASAAAPAVPRAQTIIDISLLDRLIPGASPSGRADTTTASNPTRSTNPASSANPDDSARTRARLDTSARAYWHALFDPCPSLLQVADAEGRALFMPLMKWAAARSLSMDWALHAWCYRWLQGSPFAAALDTALAEALLAASAARWTVTDIGASQCIVIACPRLDGWITARKSTSVGGSRAIERIEVDGAPRAGNTGDWFSSHSAVLDIFPGWTALPA